MDLRLRPLDRARPGRRRHAHARVRAAGGRPRRRDAALAGDDREDGGRRHASAAAARRCSRCRSCRRARRAARCCSATAQLVAVARRHVSHGGRHEHHARGSRRRARDVPVGVRHDGRAAATAAAARRAACCTGSARASSTSSARPISRAARVLVQGVGAVGARSRARPRRGGRARCSSPTSTRRAAASRPAPRSSPAAEALATECDVYSPCAVGGTLSAETIPQLRCRIVAGSANNQLAEPEDAERLRAAGILYAPDYVINAGGVIQLVGLEDRRLVGGRARARISPRSATRCARIYRDADAGGVTPAAAARAASCGAHRAEARRSARVTPRARRSRSAPSPCRGSRRRSAPRVSSPCVSTATCSAAHVRRDRRDRSRSPSRSGPEGRSRRAASARGRTRSACAGCRR